MKTSVTCMYVFVCLLAFGAIGCDNEQSIPTSALDSGVEESEDAPLVTYRFFTGRDSFGVAMKIRLDGEATTTTDGRCAPDMTVVLSGTGHATHLGQIDGTLSHCAALGDLSSFYDGEFSFWGATGGMLTGNYPPQPVVLSVGKSGTADNGDVIETKAEINGGQVDAVQRENVEGRGDLRILLEPDGGFTQTFDGWLLHHLASD